jgi:hypothetical protein
LSIRSANHPVLTDNSANLDSSAGFGVQAAGIKFRMSLRKADSSSPLRLASKLFGISSRNVAQVIRTIGRGSINHLGDFHWISAIFH